MLIEGFDAWRKEQEAIRDRAPLPCFTSVGDWRHDFELYMHSICVGSSTIDIMIDLAWQLYIAQVCLEGFVEDIEDLQEQIEGLEEIVGDHDDWIGEVSA